MINLALNLPSVRPSVLLLDDDQDLLELMESTLTHDSQYSVVVAHKLSEIEQHASKVLSCRVAVLDIDLGIGQPSGLDAYSWLRTHRYQGRIIFLTGHARQHPMVRAACAFGDAQVLAKPISPTKLMDLVKKTEF